MKTHRITRAQAREMTILEAREWAMGHLQNMHEIKCPVCRKHARYSVYTFSDTMARTLIWLAEKDAQHPGSFWHIPTQGRPYMWKSNNVGKLRYWGFVEAQPNDNERTVASGSYRITDAGRRVVRDKKTRIARQAVCYNKDCLWLTDDDKIAFSETLESRFDIRDAVLDGA